MDDKEDVLQYKKLAAAVVLQAAHDIEELPPGDPHRVSSEKFLRSQQPGHIELRSRWRDIATIDD